MTPGRWADGPANGVFDDDELELTETLSDVPVVKKASLAENMTAFSVVTDEASVLRWRAGLDMAGREAAHLRPCGRPLPCGCTCNVFGDHLVNELTVCRHAYNHRVRAEQGCSTLGES